MEDFPQEQVTSIKHLAQQLKEYKILKQLGIGGMGIVFLAKHRLTDRLEVLKILRPDLASRPKLKVRFLREVKLAAMLDHPHVVKTYTAVQNGPLLGLVLEYVDGLNLEAIVSRSGPMRISTAISVMQQAASGLAHAAACGLIHRDIKPSNILVRRVDNQLQAKITDFGLSKAEEDETDNETNLTVAGRFLGTPDYMAPEQGLDASQANTVSDVYSLGCTMFFALTGRPPYKGANALAVLNAHLTHPVPDIRQYRSDVPETLANLLTSMLQKDPKQRCQSPQQVIESLKQIAAGAASSPANSFNSNSAQASATTAAEQFTTIATESNSAGQEAVQIHVDQTVQPSQLADLGIVKPRQVAGKSKPRKRKTSFAWSTLIQLLIPIGFLGFAYYYFRPGNSADAVGTLRLLELVPGTTIEIDGFTEVAGERVSESTRDIPLRVGAHKVRILSDGEVLHAEEINIKANGILELTSEKKPLVNPRRDRSESDRPPIPPREEKPIIPVKTPQNDQPREESTRVQTEEPEDKDKASGQRTPAPVAEMAPSSAKPIAVQASDWLEIDRPLPALVRPATALSIVPREVSTNGNPILSAIAPDIHSWDLKTGVDAKISYPMSRMRKVEVSNNDQYVLYANGYQCQIWGLKQNKFQRLFNPLEDMNVERDFALSGDSRMLACCGHDQQYTRWNLETGAVVIKTAAKQPMATDDVMSIHFTPRLDTVIVLGKNGALHAWSSANGESQGQQPASPSKVIGAHVNSAQGKLFSIHDNGKLVIYKLPYLQLAEEHQLPVVDIQATAMSNKVLICADRKANVVAVDISIPAVVGRVALKTEIAGLASNKNAATCAVVSPDSRQAAVSLFDGTIHVLNIRRPRN